MHDRQLCSRRDPGGADAAAFARAAHALYQTVVAPAAAFVGERRLLVVPEGALSYAPFESLVTDAGGTDYAALPYLLKRNEVVYAPSASVVAALRRQSAGAGAGGAGSPGTPISTSIAASNMHSRLSMPATPL